MHTFKSEINILTAHLFDVMSEYNVSTQLMGKELSC